MAKSLDIPERQILLYFEGDLATPWHHRILMERIGGSRWIVVTPTFDIEVVDLTEAEDLRPVDRDALLPVACRPCFSFEPVDNAELSNLRWQCRRYADVMGVEIEDDGKTVEETWMFADPSNDRFASAVPAAMLAGGRAMIRGAIALVQEDANDDDSFTVVEKVRREDVVEWVAEKRAGAGRDPRLNAGAVGKDGRLLLSVAVSTMKAVEKPSWPFKGPSATKEVMEGIRASGMEPPSYCAHYLASSGLNPHGGIAQEFKHLVSILWMMVCDDRLDVLNVSSCEYVCRRILMI